MLVGNEWLKVPHHILRRWPFQRAQSCPLDTGTWRCAQRVGGIVSRKLMVAIWEDMDFLMWGGTS